MHLMEALAGKLSDSDILNRTTKCAIRINVVTVPAARLYTWALTASEKNVYYMIHNVYDYTAPAS